MSGKVFNQCHFPCLRLEIRFIGYQDPGTLNQKAKGNILKLRCARRNNADKYQRLLAAVFELMLLPTGNENRGARFQLNGVSVNKEHTVARVHENLVLPVVLVEV